MNRSTMVLPLSTSLCGTIGLPSPCADCAMKDRVVTEARPGPRGLLGGDVEQRLHAPDRCELSDRGLRVDPDVPGVDRQREGLGRRQSLAELVVHQQAPHLTEGHAADEVVDVDAAITQRATLLVGFGDLDSKAMTPSRPGRKSGSAGGLDWADVVVNGVPFDAEPWCRRIHCAHADPAAWRRAVRHTVTT
jgi:hypothetical protein